jgi:hypothetical protein
MNPSQRMERSKNIQQLQNRSVENLQQRHDHLTFLVARTSPSHPLEGARFDVQSLYGSNRVSPQGSTAARG